jgi:hypothetical protein
VSVEAWIAIAIAILSPAASWLIHSRLFEAKTGEWRQSVTERLERIERTQGLTDLASFKAMDARREMDWAQWRQSVDLQMQQIIKSFAEWRHNDYAPEARAQSRAIASMQEQIAALKERAERIERKVFTGGRGD